MIDEASMWTYVEVPRINSDQASKMEGFFRVLDMQLSRTAELPLDVVFFPPEAQSIHNRIIEIFLKYETFPRWRSLVLRMDYIENLDRPNASQRPDTHFFVSERFCGLESLKLVYYSYVSLFESLRGTIAGRPSSLPRLTLELFNTYVNTVEARERLSVQGEMVSMIYGESLDQLSGLILPNFAGHRFESEFLPRHITEIECAVRSSHPFPHVRYYTIDRCTLLTTTPPSLGSLVNLFASEINVEYGCDIILDRLEHLSFASLQLPPRATLSAPRLQRLHIRKPTEREKRYSYYNLSELTKQALGRPHFALIPSQVLLVNDDFDAQTVIHLLRRCMHIKDMSFTFKKDTDALEVLEYLAAGNELEHNPVLGSSRLDEPYGRQFKLRMRFLHVQGSATRCKDLAAELVGKRNESGISLKIYGKWEGDNEYMLLA